MSVQRALLLDTYLQSSTRSFRRPEDERHLSYDIPDFNQLEFTLDANDDTLAIPAAQRSFGAVSFVHFYAPYAVELTIGTLVIPDFKKLFVISGSLTGLSVRNLSKDHSVTCNLVYA